MVDLKRIGEFIAACRREKKLTQKQLGEKLNVTDRAVSKWETGRSLPDVSLLESLWRELDISVSELLAGKRIVPEQYQQETENMLLASVGRAQLRGFQIVIYIIGLAALVAFYVPFFNSRETEGFWPPVNAVTVVCWVLAASLLGCAYYLGVKLPERRYRESSATLVGIMCALLIFIPQGLVRFLRTGDWEIFVIVSIVAVLTAFMGYSKQKQRNERDGIEE